MTRSATITISATDNGFKVQGAGKELVTNQEKEVAGHVSEVLKELLKTPAPYGIAEPKPAQQK